MSYEQVVELARRQRELVDAGRWEAAAAIGAAWPDLVAGLPVHPPASARPLLEEALAIVDATGAALARELEHVALGRRALASYLNS